MTTKKRDVRVYLKKQQKPFPDPGIPMPKVMTAKSRDSKPKVREHIPSFGVKRTPNRMRKTSRII